MSLTGTTALSASIVLPFWLSMRQMPPLAALGFTSAFALCAWGLRAVSLSGALVGLLLTFVVCLAAGPAGFLSILTLFILTFIATRFGYSQKQRGGTAERRHGRTGTQVLANVGAAAMSVAPLLVWHRLSHVLLVGFSAALAEAAADTVSSEIGQVLSPRKAYLITNLERIEAGIDGGISLAGCIAGLVASVIVCKVCEWSDLLLPRWFWLAALLGAAGMLLDSVLGAKLERPGRLGNNSVNFISTALAAFAGILLSFLSR